MLASEDLLLPGLENRIAESKVPVLSANVYKGDARIAKPFVVHGKTAIVGLTNMPPKMAGSPTFDVRDPAKALEEILPKIQAERVIVATSMTAIEARSLKAPLVLCRPSAASKNSALKRDGWIVSIGASNAAVTKITPGDPPQLATVAVASERDPKVVEILKRHGAVRELDLPKIDPPVAPESITEFAPGKRFRLSASAKNKVGEFFVKGVKLVAEFQGEKGPYLVVSLRIENIAPLKRVENRMMPTPYVIPDLSNHLYLVLGGKYSLPLAKATLPNAIALKDRGDEIEGEVAFRVPEKVAPPAELVFFDFSQGHVRFAIAGKPVPAKPEYLAKPAKNQHLSLGVVSLRKEQGLAILELTGTSVAKGSIVNMSMGEYAWLIEDDLYAYAPVEAKTAEPSFNGMVRFLPEGYPNHGVLAFRIPEKHGKLKFGFYPEEGGHLEFDVTPDLKESKVELKPKATVKDGDLLQVEFLSAKIADGRAIVDIVATALGEDETVQTREQFLVDGAACSGHTAKLPHGPPEYLKVPKKKRRRFELAFDVDKDARELKLEYRGFTKGEVVTLELER